MQTGFVSSQRVWPWLVVVAVLPGCYQGVRGDPEASGSAGAEPTDGSFATEGASGDGTDGAGDTEGNQDTGDGIPACDPSMVPGTVALRRLTRVQYANTVNDLVGWALPADSETIAGALAPLIARIPDDVRQPAQGQHLGGFRRMDQFVQQQHVDAGYGVGRAVGKALTQSPARLEAVAGSCATDADASNDDSCVDAFLRTFGERALRRPLYDEEVVTYRQIFDADGMTEGMDPEAFADAIAAIMIAPSFMYMVEHGVDAVPEFEGVFELSTWEVASRLSYHFWQTAPDDALREAAADGSLATDEGYAAQVDRLFADPRAQLAVSSFYRDWLWLDDVAPVDSLLGDAAYDAFVGDTPIDEETQANMVQEVLDMVTYYTFQTEGTIEDLFLSDRSFAKTDDLAAIYQVGTWDGGEPPIVPHQERVGILGRAAMLSNRTTATRPILKGVLIRTSILCDEVPPPPPNAQSTVPEFDGEMNTRQIVEELTEQAGSACAACHSTLINPLGFVSENFDALGRFREEQPIYDSEGNVVARAPIQTQTTPLVDVTDDRTAGNLRELGELLLESDKLRSCFARNYLRFTFARDENLQRDACVLGELVDGMDEGATLADTLRAIALRPEFRQRDFD